MDREQIIQMALEAGGCDYANANPQIEKTFVLKDEQIERFAAAIRAATKEEDARICEEEYKNSGEDYEYGGCLVAADAIRASK